MPLRTIGFICGCGHTGTTLVATILAAHPSIFVPLRETSTFLGADDASIERRVGRLLDEATSAERPVLVEKTPRHIQKLDLIRRRFPGARFILTVRDGRDVAASFMRRLDGLFQPGFDRWVDETGIVLDERQKSDVLILRYEDLVSDAAAQVSLMCSFLDVTFHPEMLEYHRSPHMWHGRTEVRRTTGVGDEHDDLRNWQVNQPLFDGRGRWKSELTKDMVGQFEHGRAAELMRSFGYSESAGN